MTIHSHKQKQISCRAIKTKEVNEKITIQYRCDLVLLFCHDDDIRNDKLIKSGASSSS